METHPLRRWRHENGLDQEAAAELLGLKIPTLSRYETGARAPRLALAARLSKKTGIPIEKFVKQGEAAQ